MLRLKGLWAERKAKTASSKAAPKAKVAATQARWNDSGGPEALVRIDEETLGRAKNESVLS